MCGSIDILYFLKEIGSVKEKLNKNQISKKRLRIQLVMSLKNIIHHWRHSYIILTCYSKYTIVVIVLLNIDN